MTRKIVGRDGKVWFASFSIVMVEMEMEGHLGPLPIVSLDAEGFTAWYCTMLPRVYGYLYKATGGDRSKTENLTQDTFLQAVRTLQRGGHSLVSVPWLLAVAGSRLIDAARAESRADHKLELVWRSTGRDVDLAGIELHDINVRELLAGLRPLERTALALRYVDDLAVADVARELGRGVRATESLLVRARRRLRVRLEEMTDV